MNIIYSPFEHPTIIECIKSFCKETENTYKELQGITKKFRYNSNKTEHDLIEKFKSEFSNNIFDSNKKNIFIISEVYFATGKILPINEIINYIRATIEKTIIVVDSSQSIGNLTNRSFNVDFDYLFYSAQKWLLSPVPMGILIKKKSNSSKFFYDTWHKNDIPYATVDINEIAHFFASLSLIEKIGLQFIHKRQNEFIRIFIEKLNSTKKFTVISNNYYESSIVSIIPNYTNNIQWKETNKDRLTHILENDLEIYGSIVGKFQGRLILRLTFSYYLDLSTIHHLVKQLNRAIK